MHRVGFRKVREILVVLGPCRPPRGTGADGIICSGNKKVFRHKAPVQIGDHGPCPPVHVVHHAGLFIKEGVGPAVAPIKRTVGKKVGAPAIGPGLNTRPFG